MTKYEYDVVDLSHPSIDVKATLNNFGKLGFKFVSKFIMNDETYLILQKEINE